MATALSGCASESGTVTKNDTPQSAATVEETPAEAESTTPTFGDTYTWPDGLAVTISEPADFAPSEYAAGQVEGEPALSYDVTVTNGTDEDVEAVAINLTVSSAGKQASPIFDSAGGTDMPTATILPGKSLTWKVAYSVADPTDVQITVDNVFAFESTKVHFSN